MDWITRRSRNRSAPPPPALAFGDSVRVRAGPLVGLHGLYAGQAARDRIVILLDMLGKQRSVSLPADDVLRRGERRRDGVRDHRQRIQERVASFHRRRIQERVASLNPSPALAMPEDLSL